MAGPIIPAMPLATALVLGIPSYWPWHSSCCWNVTAAHRWRLYTCTRLQLPERRHPTVYFRRNFDHPSSRRAKRRSALISARVYLRKPR